VPAVSVITPAYNAADFVAQTIESVRAQTFADWELVIVDDGSTDATTELIEDYRERDGRIRMLHQANAGPSAARNHGMRAARGAFFAFLDSDDTWDPEYLERQLAVVREYPGTDLVTGVARYRGGPHDGRAMRPFTSGYPVLTLRDIIADDTAVFIMTLFRREVFETIGGLDEMQWRSEDYDFWLRAATAGFVFRRNAQPLGHYRVRQGSLSQNTVDMLRGILQTYEKVRPACPPGSLERARLDVQVARFEREVLLTEAKLALERRAYGDAARHLRSLQARGGGPLVTCAAWLAEHAPAAALFAYRLRHLRRYARPHRHDARRASPAGMSAS
jgi:glycosyltransferase involved in cell wall biosynthesis